MAPFDRNAWHGLTEIATLVSDAVEPDTIAFKTTNAFLTHQKNYETFNNSFITGNSVATIRSQDNPKILIDGIPINPIFIDNTGYNEFLGHMHLLSYDIQDVNVNTFHNDYRIISGNYNNAISFHTSDIQLGESAYQFEANNFTSLAYQDFDSPGYSTVFNLKAQKSFEKFGYRVSLNNGFQNDYIPENGLQRYGGNLKLKYNPVKPLLLTGFVDYTHFEDSKWSGEKIQTSINSLVVIDENNMYLDDFFFDVGENSLTSNRLFTYINADLDIADWLAIYGKYSYNKVSDSTKRYIEHEIDGFPNVIYDEKRNYTVSSSYFDIGLNFKKLLEENTSVNLTIGYNKNGIKYEDKAIEFYRHSSRERYAPSLRKPTLTEGVLYSSFKLQNKQLTFSYLFNKTFFGFEHYSLLKKEEDNSFTNHLVSLNYAFIKNDDKKVNRLELGATYGKLANYSIIPQAIYATNINYSEWYQNIIGGSPQNPKSTYDVPDYIVPFDNDNIELNLFSSFLKKRIGFSFTYYYKNYKEDFILPYSWSSETSSWSFKSEIGMTSLLKIGKVTKNGFEINGDFHFIRNKSLDWIMKTSFSNNVTGFKHHEELALSDTTISNNLFSLMNSFRYKRFQLFIEFEHKSGYDVNLYGDDITVALPISYLEETQITEVNNKGVPISKELNRYVPEYDVYIAGDDKYITRTDYFILKQIGLQYQINDNASKNTYMVGLQYNRMRRLYHYVHDAANYQSQFQQPSFYNAISLSVTMRF